MLLQNFLGSRTFRIENSRPFELLKSPPDSVAIKSQHVHENTACDLHNTTVLYTICELHCTPHGTFRRCMISTNQRHTVGPLLHGFNLENGREDFVVRTGLALVVKLACTFSHFEE
jgi:hypothetical protein